MWSNIALVNPPHLNSKQVACRLAKLVSLLDAVSIKIDMGVIARDFCDLFHEVTMHRFNGAAIIRD